MFKRYPATGRMMFMLSFLYRSFQIALVISIVLFSFCRSAMAVPPRDSVGLDAAVLPMNFRLHVEFGEPTAGSVRLSNEFNCALPKGAEHDVAVEYPPTGAAVLRVWTDGKLTRGPEEVVALSKNGAKDFPEAKIDMGGDFTVITRFITTGNGTLIAKCPPADKWAPNAKALFIRDGKLTYDIGWLGEMTGGKRVDDGKPHVVVLSVTKGKARLWLDGKLAAEKADFTRPDSTGHIIRVGRASTNFGFDLLKGKISDVKIWNRALSDGDVALLFKNKPVESGAAALDYSGLNSVDRPIVTSATGAMANAVWIQPLERSDHSALVSGWNEKTLEEGRDIYNSLCVYCHGTKEQPGSLPTALRFGEGVFKNGSDPHSMYTTLTKGFGQMVPQEQYTTAQKYAVIQYIRETFIRPHNKLQWSEVTPAMVANLPRGLVRAEPEKEDKTLPQYKRMDFGPALFWTFQVTPGNIAYKAIAVRLDDGPGGVSKGRAWMVYDHDTMRVATATTGDFVDWKGIAFDGSHNSHTSLTGDRHFVNPVGPGYASPEGKWDDNRMRGRDNLPYGPLAKEWAHYEGMYLQDKKVVIAATVGGTRVLESPGWIDYGSTPIFYRTINVAKSTKPVLIRVAPDTANVVLAGDGKLMKDNGFWVAEIVGPAKSRLFISRMDAPSITAMVAKVATSLDLEPMTHGGKQRWPQEIVTTSEVGKEVNGFATDTFPLPVDNPWDSWMRPGGFDFTPDGKAAIVATWNGDVWRVDGLMSPAPAKLQWKRIATGLFQPLGVKFRGNDLFILCRDQLVRLRDLNSDGEADFIENFNNDHQVTQHFHEFAMGLQTDPEGNFYYAKSARHALPAVVPHHGTLLRISADGSHTDILANGFRAANGVCLNDDGTVFVTDQEGHWTPKNRINRVKPGGFYGNMFGFTSVTDSSDAAMEPPMVWITNEKDRSPAELLWVPKNAWGNLAGSLLNISYGTGRVFVVPHELVNGKWQGAVCELPMPAFATGIMRGRFSTIDGALYTCGMFAWAGNAVAPGGFHRIRHDDKPAHIPTAIHATAGKLTITFSETLDPASINADAFKFKVWYLKRSATYGSSHQEEHAVPITAATVDATGRIITLQIPTLAPTQCYELAIKVKSSTGAEIVRSMHGTLHEISSN